MILTCMHVIEALLYVNKTKRIDKKVNYVWLSPYSDNFILSKHLNKDIG